ncbi:MAG: Ribosomal large subunit pseudouridine synthase D [Holosporales bacterium]
MIKDHITVVNGDNVSQRLDVFLNKNIPDSTRTQIQTWIQNGCVRDSLGNTIEKPSIKTVSGGVYVITPPPLIEATPSPSQMALDIVFEDAHLLVINKPKGLVVHPGAGHMADTLVNGLLFHCKDLSGIGGVLRPGIVHRLDKDTSGLMVVAKHDKVHHHLSLQFQEKGNEKGICRQYIGFCWGAPLKKRGRIETLIGRHPTNRQKMSVVQSNGKVSITEYCVRDTFNVLPNLLATKILFTLLTGRTHQIRVHVSSIKMPMIGDQLYGKTFTKKEKDVIPAYICGFDRQALHACFLSFIHPITEERLSFCAPLPKDLEDLESALKNYPH